MNPTCPVCHESVPATARFCKGCQTNLVEWVAAEKGRTIPGWSGPPAPAERAATRPAPSGVAEATSRPSDPAGDPKKAASLAIFGLVNIVIGFLLPAAVGSLTIGDMTVQIGGYVAGTLYLILAAGISRGVPGCMWMAFGLYLVDSATKIRTQWLADNPMVITMVFPRLMVAAGFWRLAYYE